MLVNKNKTMKKTSKKELNDYEDNILSMRSWVRKIEQTTNSVSSRLNAVEKRISSRRLDSNGNSISGVTIIDGPIDKVISELKDGKEKNSLEYVFRVVDSEIGVLQDELDSQQNDIMEMKNSFEACSKSLDEIKEEIKQVKDVETKFLSDFRMRLEKIERRAPPVVKLGRMEVPIEIAGVIAGVIAIFAAVFIVLGHISVLTSPVFLSVVGLVFIGSALFKSFKSV